MDEEPAGGDVSECVGDALDQAVDLTVRFLSNRADLRASAAFVMNRVGREGPVRLTALAARATQRLHKGIPAKVVSWTQVINVDGGMQELSSSLCNGDRRKAGVRRARTARAKASAADGAARCARVLPLIETPAKREFPDAPSHPSHSQCQRPACKFS